MVLRSPILRRTSARTATMTGSPGAELLSARVMQDDDARVADAPSPKADPLAVTRLPLGFSCFPSQRGPLVDRDETRCFVASSYRIAAVTAPSQPPCATPKDGFASPLGVVVPLMRSRVSSPLSAAYNGPTDAELVRLGLRVMSLRGLAHPDTRNRGV
jgi:hypothetical protein